MMGKKSRSGLKAADKKCSGANEGDTGDGWNLAPPGMYETL